MTQYFCALTKFSITDARLVIFRKYGSDLFISTCNLTEDNQNSLDLVKEKKLKQKKMTELKVVYFKSKNCIDDLALSFKLGIF